MGTYGCFGVLRSGPFAQSSWWWSLAETLSLDAVGASGNLSVRGKLTVLFSGYAQDPEREQECAPLGGEMSRPG